MLGRSLVALQHGNNKNELFETGSFPVFRSDDKLKEEILQTIKDKNIKPDDTVSDEELEKIVNATSVNPDTPNYHKWASDIVRVFNVSDNLALPNPATIRREKRKEAELKRREAIKQLQPYLPELVSLRNAITDTTVTIQVPVTLNVECKISLASDHTSMCLLRGDGKTMYSTQELIDRDALKQTPQFQALVNHPARIAYINRCDQLAHELGLERTDVENETYRASETK